MACRFSDDTAVRNLASDILCAATELVKHQVDDFSLETIQACILIGNVYGAEGEYRGESLYFGIAFRMAQILRLPEPSPTDDMITQEVKLRVWWSLYMIDRWSSIGNGLPRQIFDDGSSPLPMEEAQFCALAPGSPACVAMRPGLWGNMIQLAEIFSRVQDLHRQHVNHQISEDEAELATSRLAIELDHFEDCLPPATRMSEANAIRYASKGHGSAFIALHLGFHHYSTLLYFHYLDLQLPRDDRVTTFASRCKYHAAAFSDLLKLSTRVSGCDAVYVIVAHMAVVSSAALLHTLFFGDQSELDITRERLKFNFETLVRLGKYWSAVGDLMERLFIFQNACMWSADPNTHKVDRWMVRFLLQHALPVTEKYSGASREYSVRGEYADDAMAILRGTLDLHS